MPTTKSPARHGDPHPQDSALYSLAALTRAHSALLGGPATPKRADAARPTAASESGHIDIATLVDSPEDLKLDPTFRSNRLVPAPPIQQHPAPQPSPPRLLYATVGLLLGAIAGLTEFALHTPTTILVEQSERTAGSLAASCPS